MADATSTTTIERVGTARIHTVRNADFTDLMRILDEQQAHKVDMVVPAEKLRFADGMLIVEGQEMILDEDGFTDPNGAYWPTQVFDDQVAERLDINSGYLRRLRHGKTDRNGNQTAAPRLDLWDANVNGLLRGRKAKTRTVHVRDETGEVTGFEQQTVRDGVPADARSFFLRLMRPEDGVGIARAMLSNKFARLDNIDGLMAMLKGIQDAGIDAETLRIYGDLSETRMFVHVAAPQILTAAPGLLEGYRSPFDTGTEATRRQGRALTVAERIDLGRRWNENGRQGLGDDRAHGFFEPGTEPLVHAGFCLTNSEVGAGRWAITPEITVLRCTNGLTMTKDGFARSHLGARLDDGHIAWSADTLGKELAFVTAQTRDVVKAVLSTDYLEEKVAELERKSGRPVDEPEKVIEVVAKKLTFSREEQEGILRHFLLAGQLTSGGVMQAVTSYSQTLADPDAAHDLNNRAVEALELAFAMS